MAEPKEEQKDETKGGEVTVSTAKKPGKAGGTTRAKKSVAKETATKEEKKDETTATKKTSAKDENAEK